MEGAFFVSRTDLLQWVNKLLAVNLTKVEQCASGSVYCQIVDSCHPGTVKMGKLNWMARADHEYIPNYKILQAAFDRNCIEKHLDVDKLVRAKYQDNLEILQWMKCYWEHEGAGRHDYEPIGAREGRPLPAWAKSVGMPAPARSEPGQEKENLSVNRGVAGRQKFNPGERKPAAQKSALAVGGAAAKAARAGIGVAKVTNSGTANAVQEDLRLKVADQAEELEELRSNLEGLENERDYYFTKLRNVEVYCNHLQSKTDTVDSQTIMKDVLALLYAEDDEQACPGEAAPQDAPEMNLDSAAGTLYEGQEELNAEQAVAVA
jgi:RP/EB family microtubule-associated protein